MSHVSERRLRDDALAIWKAGVAAVEAGALVRASLTTDPPDGFDFSAPNRIAVVGAGKATTAMARAAEEVLGDRISAGWVNVPDATIEKFARIHVHGARKLPDNRPTTDGVEGSKKILEIARSLDADDLLLVLLSGGGSALLPLPVDGVSLADKLVVTKLLQERGATIREMNCVRKHVSQIKGGRLAQATKAAVITLAVSDVVGDPLDVIASGPTAPDPTTFGEALAVLANHGLLDEAPASVVAHLQAGADGDVEETPKSLDEIRVGTFVIGGNNWARYHARIAANRLGYYRDVDLGDIVGDTEHAARELAKWIKATARGAERACFVSGGETTVSLPPVHGKGGRNQEFALAVLDALGPDGFAGICILCGGTDGEDGPTDAAGAFVDEDLAREAQRRGLDPADFLRRHDAYNFFDPLGGLVKTGPTNTNVMDLRVVLIDRTEGAAVPALAEPKRKRASGKLDPRTAGNS
jgi:hydroxypyruvate reductase/glycerate 2-kinase